MRPNKLIPLLKPFNTKQLKRLNEFAQSPFFNKKQEIIDFIHYVTAQAPRWNEKNLTDEKIFQAVFPKEKYDQNKLYYLRSEVIQLVESFIMYQPIQPDSFAMQFQLLNYYQKNELQTQYESVYKDIQKQEEKTPIKDAFYHFKQFQLYWNKAEYEYANSGGTKMQTIDDAISQLDIFYLANRLSLALSQLANSPSSTANLFIQWVKSMMNYVESNAILMETPAVLIPYRLFYILYEEVDIQYFDETFEALVTYSNQFTHEQLLGFYSVLRNYVLKQANKGNADFSLRSLSLYKMQLSQGLLWDKEGFMLPSVFKNIITLALQLKEIDWAETFVNEQQTRLPENTKADIVSYAQARIAFAQKNYAMVLRSLHNMETNVNVLFQLGCRKLLIQTYFELHEWENVQYQINSFRVYLHRENTLSETKKKFSLNFVILVNQLMQIYTDTKENLPKNFQKIDKLMEEMGSIAEKTWILEKIRTYKQ